MQISTKYSYEENIKFVKELIQNDYMMTDIECKEMLLLVDKITPDMINSHSTIMLQSDTTSKIIIIDQPNNIKTYELKNTKNKTKYIIICGVLVLLIATYYWKFAE